MKNKQSSQSKSRPGVLSPVVVLTAYSKGGSYFFQYSWMWGLFPNARTFWVHSYEHGERIISGRIGIINALDLGTTNNHLLRSSTRTSMFWPLSGLPESRVKCHKLYRS